MLFVSLTTTIHGLPGAVTIHTSPYCSCRVVPQRVSLSVCVCGGACACAASPQGNQGGGTLRVFSVNQS